MNVKHFTAQEAADAIWSAHAIDAAKRRCVDPLDVDVTLVAPEVVRESGDQTIYTRKDLSVVMDVKSCPATVVTLVWNVEHEWTDEQMAERAV